MTVQAPLEAPVKIHKEAALAMETASIFIEDLEAVSSLPEGPRNRLVVLAFFCFVEATCEHFRRLAASMALQGFAELSPGDLAIALGQEWTLGDHGDPRSRRRNDRTLPRIEFALRVFATVAGSAWKVDRGVAGWSAFVATKRIRDRLAHPGAGKNSRVSGSEMGDVHVAIDWFQVTSRLLLVDFNARLRREVDRLSKGNAELSPSDA